MAVTERVIDEDCREHKRQESNAMWEKLSKTRTGIMDREAASATRSTTRREPPPGKPKVKPSDMTDEQWALVVDDWWHEHEERESRMNGDDNPETGESRWVNTRHIWERDR